VRALAATGTAVRAAVTTGSGLFATTTTGTAVFAQTDGSRVGTALRTNGRVRFDNSVGIATIAVATSSVTVTPGIDLSATLAVVAALQDSAGGTTTIHRCVVNATTDTFTIYLTAKATAAVKVAWHVFGWATRRSPRLRPPGFAIARHAARPTRALPITSRQRSASASASASASVTPGPLSCTS